MCTYNFIFKDSFVILVNLDSLRIEVTGCMINDQELFLEGSPPYCCVQAICGVCLSSW